MGITPQNTEFVVLSFEGPDVYSMAGGLGARITHLTRTLADVGFKVHHLFIGDPRRPGTETTRDGRLVLHRWCQWISEYHPRGVYDGEEGKLSDFTRSAPPFLVREIAAPCIREGKILAVLCEEWQTVNALCHLNDLLGEAGIRHRAVIFWNANNTYSFDRIDWGRLTRSATLSTVSKYMKQLMRKMGLNPFVIPNGIQKELLKSPDPRLVARIRRMVQGGLLLSKVARWHPDKGWGTAIQAVERLKRGGRNPLLMARGSMEAYGEHIASNARSLGLTIRDVFVDGDVKEHYHRALFDEDFSPYLDAIAHGSGNGNGRGDVLNLAFPVPFNFLQAVYKASDVVLANSAHEPFGLVGLEAMATGSIVFTGCSGEDYASHLNNAIVLDTFGPEEIEFYVNMLEAEPEKKARISRAARRTAQQWIWEEVVKELICKLEYQARVQGVQFAAPAPPEPAPIRTREEAAAIG